jgi:hypothetical protein
MWRVPGERYPELVSSFIDMKDGPAIGQRRSED